MAARGAFQLLYRVCPRTLWAQTVSSCAAAPWARTPAEKASCTDVGAKQSDALKAKRWNPDSTRMASHSVRLACTRRIWMGLVLVGMACCLPMTAGAEDQRTLLLVADAVWADRSRGIVGNAVAVRAGRVLAVGSEQAVRRQVGSSPLTVLRFEDALVLPGLVDCHAHLQTLGELLEQVDLRDCRSEAEAVEKVRRYAAKRPELPWIVGYGWDQSLWPDRRFPTKQLLSEAVPDRPVWLRRVGGHAGWCNEKALQIAGIDQHTPDPPGGRILRDEAGQPTGVLLDEAMGLVTRHIPPPSDEDLRRRYLLAQRECLRYGLTCVHDAGLSEREANVLRRMDLSGELRIRVYGMLSAPQGPPWGWLAKPPRWKDPDRRFVLRAVKLFADGAMGSRGAWLFQPYADEPGSTGLVLMPPEQIERITRQCLRTGWQVCTHAIGDRANYEVLKAYQRALQAVPAADPRLRIEHAQVVRPEDMVLFGKLKVIASMQPTHATTDMRWAERRLGPARLAGAYAWRSLMRHGVRLAFGSDFPVERVSPYLGLYAAVTRQTPEGEPPGGWLPAERLTLADALDAFTAQAAFASYTEHRRGRIAVGYDADLTVVAPNFLGRDPSRVLRARTIATIVGGEVVWRQEVPTVRGTGAYSNAR